MGDAHGREILRAEKSQRPEDVLVLLGLHEVDRGEAGHEKINDTLRLDVRDLEGSFDLSFDVETARDPSKDGVGLTATIRHLLQQRRQEAQRSTLPEIRDADDVEENEPAASRPNLATQVTDEVRLADTGLTDEHATGRFLRRVLRLLQQTRDDLVFQCVVWAVGRGVGIAPDAFERLGPSEVGFAECVQRYVSWFHPQGVKDVVLEMKGGAPVRFGNRTVVFDTHQARLATFEVHLGKRGIEDLAVDVRD